MSGERNKNKDKGYYRDSDGVDWSVCPECGEAQGDMGNNVSCDACGYGPMPTRPVEPPSKKKG